MSRAKIALPVVVTDAGVEAFQPARFRAVLKGTEEPMGMGFTRADSLEDLRAKILASFTPSPRKDAPR